ncbi:ATP phosphoribosyltransferase [Acetobacteroides hydrogenigenes]|uniref:ATP phosphoribosyltransferase n=1 Tax=Acetobacteroides hydrogenigenes TaxID=979970 RepID=A0A4R2E9R5_9BACT|nr:ATP phosphoribosyltransferase [Acetobacteroides hydrogenigenes]TCN64555.1 ATP phosphoribosyltransferase [Acetobacteroides hydrogenigenes]
MRRLKIAIQKSGRLKDDSLQLLKECGISLDGSANSLIIPSRNFPVDVLYLRNSDIPQYLEDGVADVAILGENTLIEAEKNITNELSLGFSKCRVSIAIPKGQTYGGKADLNGKKLATSYPNTVKAFLTQNSIDAEIHEISGSVEIAPNLGLADAICDIVSSGSTLFTNGLKEVEVLFSSEACLASSPILDQEGREILEKLLFRIRAVLEAKNKKYVLLNAPNEKIDEIISILPGMKSPSIIPLAEPGWSSLHSVIDESEFWEIIDQLRNAGAQGILIVPIEKMII